MAQEREQALHGGQPAQHQKEKPGKERKMVPRPESEPSFAPGRRMADKVALITGGDSGIGHAVAVAFAREGAKGVAIAYLDESGDAAKVRREVEEHGCRCISHPADIRSSQACNDLIERTLAAFGQLDVLVNNAADQTPRESLAEISDEQLESTFRTNIFSMFYLTRAALPHLKAGASIVNTTSVTAYRGSKHLLDYAATKGAIVAFTRSLALQLADKGIRVNAVAPGPIWTPLIPSTFSAEQVAEFGKNVPMQRAGQPAEVAGCYVFLASEEGSYMSGQVLHPNGGEIING